jgi:hypothetical protein
MSPVIELFLNFLQLWKSFYPFAGVVNRLFDGPNLPRDRYKSCAGYPHAQLRRSRLRLVEMCRTAYLFTQLNARFRLQSARSL